MPELDAGQQRAVELLDNGKILCGVTGSGKSRVALAYYRSLNSLRDVYIITTAKKRDSLEWEKEAAGFALSPDRTASLNCNYIVVDSWNNISKYTDIKDAFFIFDEQRLVGSGAWVKAFYKIAAKNMWIMLSATPGDTWLDYIPVFVANGFYKNRTAFKRQHVVYSPYSKFPKVQRYTEEAKLIRLRRKLLVGIAYQKHTRRIVSVKPCAFRRELYSTAMKNRWDVYNKEPLRDVSGLCRVLRHIVNEDESRVKALDKIFAEHPKLIIFYNFDYELEILHEWARAKDVEFSEWNGHHHGDIPKADSWIYIVQYTAGAEGWNCTETDTEVFYSLTYSYRVFEQAQGRIDRRNTLFTELNYYILRSNSSIDLAIWKALMKKKSFNEKEFVV